MGGKFKLFLLSILQLIFNHSINQLCIFQIQVDAPEDTAMYIHRVGRTARYTAGGRGLLMLLPSEERVIVDELTNVKI